MKSVIYKGYLSHSRIHPKPHKFSYKITPWLIDLDELPLLEKKLALFAYNRPSVIAFHEKDYGNNDVTLPLKEQANCLLIQHGIPRAESIHFLCFPRILGYVFNPLSVYYCYSQDQNLSAVIYEVSNTFKERHAYVIPINPTESEQKLIQQNTQKCMHVSPFFSLHHQYVFHVSKPDNSLTLTIQLLDNQKTSDDSKVFTAHLTGKRVSLSNSSLLRSLLPFPLQTLKITAAIHWEAFRLWLKKLALFRHPKNHRSFESSLGKTVTIHSQQDNNNESGK